MRPAISRVILQTLHDLGDVLWFEDPGLELFKDCVMLDPLMLIDLIRQIINHKFTGQIMPHEIRKGLPCWAGLHDEKHMEAMKQMLQHFGLVSSADEDGVMRWDSNLILPTYWQTKTPAAWLFLGDNLRINNSETCESEAIRVHWEYHFEFGIPMSLFDNLVVASVSPFHTIQAGPHWILYEEKEIAACRLMVGQDPKTRHRTIHVEAVVAEKAAANGADRMWRTFRQIVGALYQIIGDYPGLLVSSFAWDRDGRKHELDSVLAEPMAAEPLSWLPPSEISSWLKELQAEVVK